MTTEHFPTPEQHMKAMAMQVHQEVRFDGLISTLAKESHGRLPPVDKEDAKGDYDSGMAFDGRLVQRNGRKETVNQNPPGPPMSYQEGEASLRYGWQHDGAVLYMPDRILTRQKIPNRYDELAADIFTARREANTESNDPTRMRRHYNIEDILVSYTPKLFTDYSGTKSQLVTGFAALQTMLRSFAMEEAEYFKLDDQARAQLASRYKSMSDPILAEDGRLLFNPGIICLHATRYSSRSIHGLTRILNPTPHPKYGEFQTVTFEYLDDSLLNEIHHSADEKHVFMYNKGKPIVSVLRNYGEANFRRRPPSDRAALFSTRDLAFDIKKVEEDAIKRYKPRKDPKD